MTVRCSVGKEPAMQTQGPSLNPRTSIHSRHGGSAHTSFGETRERQILELTGQPTWVNEWQVLRETLSQNIRWGMIKEDAQILTLGLPVHVCLNAWGHTPHTYTKAQKEIVCELYWPQASSYDGGPGSSFYSRDLDLPPSFFFQPFPHSLWALWSQAGLLCPSFPGIWHPLIWWILTFIVLGGRREEIPAFYFHVDPLPK